MVPRGGTPCQQRHRSFDVERGRVARAGIHALAALTPRPSRAVSRHATGSGSPPRLEAPMVASATRQEAAMAKDAVEVPTQRKPIGPFSYATRANGMLYVSGCIGVDDTWKVVGPDV